MKKLMIQIVRFGITGGLVTLVDFVLVFFFHHLLNLHVLLATLFAYAISTCLNYILSVTWVFSVKKNHARNVPVFIVLSLLGLGITEGVMWLGTSVLGVQYMIVKICATIIVNVFNFISRKILLEQKRH